MRCIKGTCCNEDRALAERAVKTLASLDGASQESVLEVVGVRKGAEDSPGINNTVSAGLEARMRVRLHPKVAG